MVLRSPQVVYNSKIHCVAAVLLPFGGVWGWRELGGVLEELGGVGGGGVLGELGGVLGELGGGWGSE